MLRELLKSNESWQKIDTESRTGPFKKALEAMEKAVQRSNFVIDFFSCTDFKQMEKQYEGRLGDLESASLTELPQESLFKNLDDQITYLHSVRAADSNRPKQL